MILKVSRDHRNRAIELILKILFIKCDKHLLLQTSYFLRKNFFMSKSADNLNEFFWIFITKIFEIWNLLKNKNKYRFQNRFNVFYNLEKFF